MIRIGMALTALLFLGGCTIQVPAGVRAAEPQVQAFVACDVSGSTSQEGNQTRRLSVGALQDLMTEGLVGTRMRLYAFDRKVSYLGEVDVEDEDTAWSTIDRKIKHASPDTGRDTYFAPVLQRFAKEATKAEDQPVVGLLFTDGQLFDPKETRAAAEKLAGLNNFKALYVAPISHEPQRLADLLESLEASDKLVFCTTEDQARGLQDMHQLLATLKRGES